MDGDPVDGQQESAPHREAKRSWWDTRTAENLVVVVAFTVMALVVLGASWLIAAGYHRWVGPTPTWWGTVDDAPLWLALVGLVWGLWDREKRQRAAARKQAGAAEGAPPTGAGPGRRGADSE